MDKYPESPHVNLARYGLGVAYYQKGDLAKARELLEAIAPADRNGDLAVVSYQLADIMIRSAPAKADDAVAAGKLEESMQTAAGLLDAFAAGQPNSPQAPDALLKLGYCRQRLAALLVQPPDQAKALGDARAAYEQLLQKYAKSDLVPQATFERAKCLAQQKDVNGAVNELRRFTNQDPLKNSITAPMAVLELATLLRGQNQAQQAADVLAQARQQWEAKLQADPAHAAWVTLLQYHHGVALREAGKRAEARAIFDQVVKAAPDRPEAADAALRFGQCLRDDGQQKIADADEEAGDAGPEAGGDRRRTEANGRRRQGPARGGAVPQRPGRAGEAEAAGFAGPRPHVLRGGVGLPGAGRPGSEGGPRQDAAGPLAEAQGRDRQEDAAGPAAAVRRRRRTCRSTAVPMQPSETQARTEYQSLIAAFPDLAINADARFELAELQSGRGEHDAAIKQLQEALDKEPSPELTDKIKVRLGAALLTKGDAKKALDVLTPIVGNPKSAMVGQATYRAGECQLRWASRTRPSSCSPSSATRGSSKICRG